MRMIERWFPCAEVSEASESGWGSGKSEKALFIWFAARPLAQAKAAVLTSLLPWPDDPGEQERLKKLVREAMSGRDAAHDELVAELRRTYPNGASMLDPFSGRAMIPLEAARLGVKAWGIDYSPVATLAGTLLADYPLRDWSNEPPLPFGRSAGLVEDRLVADVERVLDEVGRRYEASMAEFYPKVGGKQPWGYLWAVTLPCQECGRRFPVTGSLVLRHPLPVKHDPGQSYRIEVDRAAGTFRAVVHPGSPTGQPTLVTVCQGVARRSEARPRSAHSVSTSTRRTSTHVSRPKASGRTLCSLPPTSTTELRESVSRAHRDRAAGGHRGNRGSPPTSSPSHLDCRRYRTRRSRAGRQRHGPAVRCTAPRRTGTSATIDRPSASSGSAESSARLRTRCPGRRR